MSIHSENCDYSESMDWAQSGTLTNKKRLRVPLQDQTNRTKKKASLKPMPVVPMEEDTQVKHSCLELISQVNQTLEPCYAQDIHQAHLDNEERTFSSRTWKTMDDVQQEVTQQMRGILVDWLIEVADEYSLKSQTLFLTVNYVDRVLESLPIARSTLQLVGVCCMLLACKYEEIYAPLVEDFVYITDNTYSREEILRCELVVLDTLKFDLTVVTIKNFLTRFLLLAGVTDLRVVTHASYVAEMILPVYSFQKNYKPSLLAASIVVFSQHVYGMSVWSPAFEYGTKLTPKDLRQCVSELQQVYAVIAASPRGKLTAAREKYRQAKFFCVADAPVPAAPPLL